MQDLQKIYTEFSEKGFILEIYTPEVEQQFYKIYQEIVLEGTNYPQETGDYQEFKDCFFGEGSKIYICRSKTEIVGGFYIKPNFPGRGKHIANAAYMLQHASRGKGLGRLLVEASLLLARDLGYQGMQFNLVLSQNVSAVSLYEKLDFIILGTIPKAIRNVNGSFQDGYIMYKSLI